MSRRRGRTIGTVLEQLRPEFPDLTISKIRFLEAEGLVTPERTGSGYRVYQPEDIDRLRYVLEAQRDRFWPLKVIREALDALDRGLAPPADGADSALPTVPPAPVDPDVPAADEIAAVDELRLTEAELAESTGLDPALIASLHTYGLLHADPDGHYDGAALAVASAAAALAAYGVEARHLRPFRTAAEREVGLVQQIVVPHLGRDRPEDADPTAQVLHHCLALHAALVKAELRRG